MNSVSDKRYKYLWRRMQDEEVIKQAWKNLRKHKTKRVEVIIIDNNLDVEVALMKDMIAKTVREHPEEGYQPPKVRKTKIVNEHGKRRVAHLADIHEQWYFHIIVAVLRPIVERRLGNNIHGCIPGRGAHSGKAQIEKWARKGFRYVYKCDVRRFYDNTHISIVLRELRRDIEDERFLYCIEKIYRYTKKGILIGLYISPWIANYILSRVDEQIESYGVDFSRYMDDIVVVANSKKVLRQIHISIQIALSKMRLKLKRTWQIFKFDYLKKDKRIGRPIDYMGFQFYRDKTIIRKGILIRATRTARRLYKAKKNGRRYYIKMVRGMVSRMGWFKHTDSYDCYLSSIKPFVDLGKLKKIVSKYDKKEAKQNDRLERRALLGAA